jgi:hypothetical protein
MEICIEKDIDIRNLFMPSRFDSERISSERAMAIKLLANQGIPTRQIRALIPLSERRIRKIKSNGKMPPSAE